MEFDALSESIDLRLHGIPPVEVGECARLVMLQCRMAAYQCFTVSQSAVEISRYFPQDFEGLVLTTLVGALTVGILDNIC